MEAFELSPSQGMALAVLISHKDDMPCARDIETELGFSEEMVQRIISGLEQMGYLTQDGAGRAVILTDKALAVSEAAHNMTNEET